MDFYQKKLSTIKQETVTQKEKYVKERWVVNIIVFSQEKILARHVGEGLLFV